MKGNKIAIDRYLETGEVVDSLDLSVNYLVKNVKEGGTVPAKNTLVYCTGFDTSTQTPTGVWSVTNTDTELNLSNIPTAVNAQGQTGYINEIRGSLYTTVTGTTLYGSADIDGKYLQVIGLPKVSTLGTSIIRTGEYVREINMDSLTSYSAPIVSYRCGNESIDLNVSLKSIETISGKLIVGCESRVNLNAENITTVADDYTPFISFSTTYGYIYKLYLPKVTTYNSSLSKIEAYERNFPGVVSSDSSIVYDERCRIAKFDNLETCNDSLVSTGDSLISLSVPKLRTVGRNVVAQCPSMEYVYLPSLVTVGDYLIGSNCPSLKKVVVGSNITSINRIVYATLYTKLESIEIQSINPPTLTRYVDPKICVIKVPSDSVSQYKSATNWSSSADNIFANTVDTNIVEDLQDEVTVGWYVTQVPNYLLCSFTNNITSDGELIGVLMAEARSNIISLTQNTTDSPTVTTKNITNSGRTYTIYVTHEPHSDLQVTVDNSSEYSGYTFDSVTTGGTGRTRYKYSGTGYSLCVAKVSFSGSGVFNFTMRHQYATRDMWVSKKNVTTYPSLPTSDDVLIRQGDEILNKELPYSISVSDGDYIWICGYGGQQFEIYTSSLAPTT